MKMLTVQTIEMVLVMLVVVAVAVVLVKTAATVIVNKLLTTIPFLICEHLLQQATTMLHVLAFTIIMLSQKVNQAEFM